MKYIKTYESSRHIPKNDVIVNSVLCVSVNKRCKVFTVGKRYDCYLPEELRHYMLNEYKIINDLGNSTQIWRNTSLKDLEGIFSTSPVTAFFSMVDDTIENFELRKNVNKYNL